MARGAFIEPFSWDDSCDSRRVNNEKRRGDTAKYLIYGKIIDLIAHHLANGLIRRHRHLRQMFLDELGLLKLARPIVAKERMPFGRRDRAAAAQRSGQAFAGSNSGIASSNRALSSCSALEGDERTQQGPSFACARLRG